MSFLAKNGLGTPLGNVIEKRYLINASYVIGVPMSWTTSPRP
jgi:hypothetical protein